MSELLPTKCLEEIGVEVEWAVETDDIDGERADHIVSVLDEVNGIISCDSNLTISGGSSLTKCYMQCDFSTAVTVAKIWKLILNILKTTTYKATVTITNAEDHILDSFAVVPFMTPRQEAWLAFSQGGCDGIAEEAV